MTVMLTACAGRSLASRSIQRLSSAGRSDGASNSVVVQSSGEAASIGAWDMNSGGYLPESFQVFYCWPTTDAYWQRSLSRGDRYRRRHSPGRSDIAPSQSSPKASMLSWTVAVQVSSASCINSRASDSGVAVYW